MAQLLELFRELPAPTSAAVLCVRRLPRDSSVWVGRDYYGRPVVLIEATTDGTRVHGVVLRNITFEPWLTCRIVEEGHAPRDLMASVIRCTAPERELHEHFLRAVSPTCEELDNSPQVSTVARLVEKLIEVFQALAEPSHESVQGLWAELLLISRSRDIELVTQAWQPRARNLIDFAQGRFGLEVKSTSAQVRQHRFSLAQLQPVAESQRYIASLLLTSQGSGASISDLWELIEGRLGERRALRDRLAARIAQTLGEDWQRAHSRRFDVDAAIASLLVFDARSVPRVGEDADPSITDVEFTVDLSGCPFIPLTQLIARGSLFESLFSGVPRP